MKTEKKNEDYNYSIKNDDGEIVSISTSIGSGGDFNFNISITDATLYHANSEEVNAEITSLLKSITGQAKSYISNVN